jgi:hypothetical protein
MRFNSLVIVAPLTAVSAVLLACEGHTQSNPRKQAEQQKAPIQPTPPTTNPTASPTRLLRSQLPASKEPRGCRIVRAAACCPLRNPPDPAAAET